MPEKIRINVNLFVNQTVADTIQRLADERSVTVTGLVLQGLGLLQAAHDGATEGYHLGLAMDRRKLDVELVGMMVG